MTLCCPHATHYNEGVKTIHTRVIGSICIWTVACEGSLIILTTSTILTNWIGKITFIYVLITS